jgi:hypothetical protein
MPINTTVGHSGRFCNHVILNMFASQIARAGELKFEYSYLEQMMRLGLPVYTTGSKSYAHTVTIDNCDTTFHYFLEKPVEFNLDLQHTFVQNHEFSIYLYNYFHTPDVQSKIQEANPYKDRYGTNADVYVHVRLDDTAHANPGYSYYETALKSLDFEKGFVSSDSPSHPIVQDLLKNFPLQLLEKDEVETIQFGSTCKHIVLSYGTYSWMIGTLGFFSNIHIAPLEYNSWCNQSFKMPDWKIISV